MGSKASTAIATTGETKKPEDVLAVVKLVRTLFVPALGLPGRPPRIQFDVPRRHGKTASVIVMADEFNALETSNPNNLTIVAATLGSEKELQATLGNRVPSIKILTPAMLMHAEYSDERKSGITIIDDIYHLSDAELTILLTNPNIAILSFGTPRDSEKRQLVDFNIVPASIPTLNYIRGGGGGL